MCPANLNRKADDDSGGRVSGLTQIQERHRLQDHKFRCVCVCVYFLGFYRSECESYNSSQRGAPTTRDERRQTRLTREVRRTQLTRGLPGYKEGLSDALIMTETPKKQNCGIRRN